MLNTTSKQKAPAYANIYMADLEESVLQKQDLKPECFYRYPDDIFGIWTHSEEHFTRWVTTLNEHHPLLKMVPTLHAIEVNFLDVTVFKGPLQTTEGRLDTKIYFKPTDTHALLHKGSFHPKHVFKGIKTEIKQ